MSEPYGYITEESELRLSYGGNVSRGTVPLHKKRTKAARIPLYTEDHTNANIDKLATMCIALNISGALAKQLDNDQLKAIVESIYRDAMLYRNQP